MTASGDELTSNGHAVTQLLMQLGKGDRTALDELLPLVYRELDKVAKRYMAQQNPNHTLQTTALIHEAYVNLADGSEQDWENRAHFFGVAAKAMRHVLLDHARSHRAVGGGPAAEIIALDDALTALAVSYPRQAEVVELRYFAGLSVEDAARTIKVSPETVTRDWRFAKSFLAREMKRGVKS